jgi:O-antigen/teichoic acid export membrane protein
MRDPSDVEAAPIAAPGDPFGRTGLGMTPGVTDGRAMTRMDARTPALAGGLEGVKPAAAPRAVPLPSVTGDGLAQVGAKAAGLACSAGVFALAARAFDPYAFGLWAVATSLTTVVLGFDFGVGNALRNRLVLQRESGGAAESFAGAFRLLAGVAGVLMLAAVAVHLATGWRWVLHDLPADAGATGARAVLLAVLFLLIRMPLGLGMIGFFSYREARLNALADAGLSLALLAAVATAARAGLGVVPALVLYFGAMVAVVALSLAVFVRRRGWRPVPWLSAGARARNRVWLRRDAPPFALLQFVAMFGGLSATVVVSGVVGVGEAGTFRAVLVLYLALLALQMAYLMPVWSRFSEIAVTGDRGAARGLVHQTLVRSLALPGAVAVLVAEGPAVVTAWLGSPFSDRTLIAVLGLWAVLSAYHAGLSVFLNGGGHPMRSFAAYLPGAVLFVPLGVGLGHRWGALGIAWTLAVTAALSLSLMVWMVRVMFAERFPPPEAEA